MDTLIVCFSGVVFLSYCVFKCLHRASCQKTTHLFVGWFINNRWDFENDDGQKCDNAYYIEVMIGEQNCAFL